MSTALITRPEPVGLVKRVGGLRHTSPGRLKLLLTTLLTLGLLAGVVAAAAGQSARAGTRDLGGRAQPLLVEAETIYSALADADTTAAQAFLAGGLEPATLTDRYDDDLQRATTALTSAARRTPAEGAAADAVRVLSAGVAEYSALVATARANNRQGLPVGASYLSEASKLNRETLQPQARALFRTAQTEVNDGYGAAAALGWMVPLLLLLGGLLVALLLVQRYLSRRTHRTFNVPLLGATAVTAVLALVAFGVVINQQAHLGRAENYGSAPAASIAESRILALQARGDEALTLAARGSGAAYEADFDAVSERLTASGGPLVNQYGALDPHLGEVMNRAATSFRSYVDAHDAVRALDDNGNYDGAVDLAIGAKTTETFESLRRDLDAAFDDRKAVFTEEIGAASGGLGLLTVLGPLLALVICALAYAGLRARLEEYR
ncbi:hypothetical protein Ade02nite_91690 [Paractinoplanes deccanensis]|uniref:Secreted protein n=1 Tax=Paractinoplanes deccanensis TaxID=113561 RepID=A0ABQ3YKK4_9ACTN|nr:hypothetical protein [Actinoplanes deccanensis]GID80528.1 hypothetical protein Ade02nite_91690 [Actinoplanes deccanensis]